MEELIRKVGLEPHFDYIKNLRDDPFQMWGWKQLHSTYISAICSVVIAANAVFIGWAAIKTSDHALRGAPAPSEDIWLGEVIFAIFFSLELLVRFGVERWLFFVGPEWRWNALDVVLVSMSLVDVIVSVDSPTSRQNVSHGRMVRLMRFFRLARMARVVRAIGNLRVVLLAILDSMSSLFGCFVIIAMTQYVFAVLFMSATSDYFADGAPNAESAEILREYYGDFDTTMVTLFGVISGGVDWLQVALPLADVNDMYLVVFVFFVFLMQFGVLNVVVGAFVAAASEIAGKDKDALVKSELAHWENYTQRIRTFFQAADKDKSGTLTWEEFKEHLQDRKIRAYFQTMDLDVAEAGTLFKLLMEGGSEQVSLDKFLKTCHRLKGQAKSIDLKMLIVMVKNLDERLVNFMLHTGQSLNSLMDKNSMVGGRDESSYVPSRRTSRGS